jgi:hypothetical protein
MTKPLFGIPERVPYDEFHASPFAGATGPGEGDCHVVKKRRAGGFLFDRTEEVHHGE